MAFDGERVHYVLILQIEKVIKKSTSASTYNRSTESISEDLREKQEVAKIAIKDTDLNRLLNRGARHMELVQDEETDLTDTKIGKPRA